MLSSDEKAKLISASSRGNNFFKEEKTENTGRDEVLLPPEREDSITNDIA